MVTEPGLSSRGNGSSNLVHRRAHSLEEWQTVISEAMLPLQMIPTAGSIPFTGTLRSRTFNGIGMMVVEAVPHELVRRERVEVRGEHFFNVNLQLYGETVIEQSGRRAELSAGDLVVFETSANYTREFATDYGSFVLMLPQSRMGLPAEAIGAITAIPIKPDAGMGGVLSAFLLGLAQNFDTLDDRAGARIAQATIDIVTATLVHLLHVDLYPGDVRLAALRANIRSYIDLHYADPACTPQAIAKANFVSLRHLHSVFQEEKTTVAEILRRRRLEAARRALDDPTRDWQTISAIAAQCGFENMASFSRMYRAEFGMSPGEYRRR